MPRWHAALRSSTFLAITAEGPHPIPSRTRKLSLPAPMVLQGSLCGRVGRCQIYAPGLHGPGASFLVLRRWSRGRCFGRCLTRVPPDLRAPAPQLEYASSRGIWELTRASSFVRRRPRSGPSRLRAPCTVGKRGSGRGPEFLRGISWSTWVIQIGERWGGAGGGVGVLDVSDQPPTTPRNPTQAGALAPTRTRGLAVALEAATSSTAAGRRHRRAAGRAA